MRTIRILILGVLLSFAGCGGDDGTTPQTHPETPLAEATIGAAGGTLETDGFTLTVPAGAFADDTELAVYEGDDTDLPDDSVTGVYKISGAGAAATPLTLTLSISEAPLGESFVALGRAAESLSGEEYVDFTYLEAALTDTTLSVAWTPTVVVGKSYEAYEYFFGPRETRVYLDTAMAPRFSIIYPPEGSDNVATIAANLTVAAIALENMGFGTTVPGGMTSLYSIRVDFTHVAPASGGYVHSVQPGAYTIDRQGKLTLYRDHLNPTDLDAQCYGAAAGLARLLLWEQIPRDENLNQASHYQFWLQTAFSLWADDHFHADEDYVPPGFNASGLDMELGLVNQTEDHMNGAAFGCGAAALLKHLIASEGTSLMGRAVDTMRGGTLAGPAFLNAINGDASDWWADFLADFVAGGIYDAPAATFLDEATTLRMNETDWETTRTNFYTDLSARFYRLDTACDDWADGAYLDVELLSDDLNADLLEALVFTLDDGDLSLIGRGQTLQVAGLKAMHEDGVDLLIVVPNPHWDLDTSEAVEIVLDLECETSSLQAWTTLRLSFMYEVLAAGSGWGTGSGAFDSWSSEPAVWSGDTASVCLDYTDGSIVYTGELSVVFDLTTQAVTSFDGELFYQNSGQNRYWTRRIEGGAVPVDQVDEEMGWRTWRLEGGDACGPVTDLYHYETAEGVLEEEWTDWRCYTDAFLEIYLAE